jgi:DNA-3-methyladenine glycosylase
VTGRRLPRGFFDRPATEVAPDLLGRVIVRALPDGTRLSARIVETEAYEQDDPASHTFRGPTTRNAVMFGPPGHLYVYFTYGMHFCMNVVTRERGFGSAVLLRAAEPLRGLDEMARRRGMPDLRRLCAGPARLCEALGVDRASNGADVVSGRELWITSGAPVPGDEVVAGPRIGIRHGLDRSWRFVVAGSPFASPTRPTRPPSSRPSTR